MSWSRLKVRLASPARLTRRDLLWLVIPALAWAGVFHLRERVIEPRCAKQPETCQVESVSSLDRPAISLASGSADRLSFTTQHAAGLFAALLPLLWSLSLLAAKRMGPGQFLPSVATDWLLFAQASLWNGLTTESIRLLVQRPRPFVYTDPAGLGADAAHYTSFISGHTSFAAVAGTMGVLLLFGRGAPRPLVIASSVAALGLIVSTGVFRVLAGRHFATDVMAAALIGSAVAMIVNARYRSPIPLEAGSELAP